MPPPGEWQTVTRKKRFHDNWRTSANDDIDKMRPYVPYKHTYAQAVAQVKTRPVSPTSSTSSNTHRKPSPSTNTKCHYQTPSTPPATRYYTSPHNPTSLRFPPMASYQEWWSRCFCCLRLSHAATKCCNPFKCAKCWLDGHIAS